MRKLLSICLLTLCVSLPAFGGHMVIGGYCSPCGSNGCLCDPGEEPPQAQAVFGEPKEPRVNLGVETLLVLAVLLLVLRYKA